MRNSGATDIKEQSMSKTIRELTVEELNLVTGGTVQCNHRTHTCQTHSESQPVGASLGQALQGALTGAAKGAG
jgi:hypothetical protein